MTKSKNLQYQEDFKKRKETAGEKEIRGAYAKNEHHKDIKKIIKMFNTHRTKIMLFLHSLESDQENKSDSAL